MHTIKNGKYPGCVLAILPSTSLIIYLRANRVGEKYCFAICRGRNIRQVQVSDRLPSLPQDKGPTVQTVGPFCVSPFVAELCR